MPLKSNVDKILKSFEEKDIKEAKSVINRMLEETKVFQEIKKQRHIFWTFTYMALVAIIISSICLFVFKVKILYVILYFIIITPVFFFCIIANLIRLYMAWDRVSDWFVLNLNFGRAIIRANFFMDNKRIDRKYFIYSGREISYRNGIYFVDEKCIHMDNDSIPNIYFKFGLPNPLIFNFHREIDIYAKTPDKLNLRGLAGQPLDISYSSENIKLFKDDKIFSELHKTDKMDGGTILIIIVLLIIVVLIAILLFRGQPAPVVNVQPAT